MKRLFALVLALALLAGCGGSQTVDPVWQTELAGGRSFAVSGCTVREDSGSYDEQLLPLLYLDGVPTLTFTGVTAEEISLCYAAPYEEGYIPYTGVGVLPDLDYVLTRDDDGTLHYRIDTVYSYCLTVGQEQWLLVCSRDDI